MNANVNMLRQNAKAFCLIFILFQTFSVRAQLSLVSPSDNLVIGETAISFTWNKDPGISASRLEIYNNQLLTSMFYQSPVVPGDSLRVTSFVPGNTYWWRVVGYRPSGDSLFSPVRSFIAFQPGIFPGLRLWVRADSNIVQSGNQVAAWNDLSTNNTVLSQSNPARRPSLLADPYGIHTPALHFSGTLQGLAGNLVLSSSPVVELFSVHKYIGGNPLGMLYELSPDFNGSPTGLMFYYDQAGKNEVIGHMGNNGYNIISGNAARDSAYYIYNVQYNKSSAANEISARINGGLLSYSYLFNADNTNTFGTNVLNVGARNAGSAFGFNGDLAEIVLYDNALTLPQKQLVERYLLDHVSPPVNLGRDIKIDSGFCFTYLFTPDIHEYVSYSWSTGDTTPSATISAYGSYWLQATDQFGRTSSDTIIFTPDLRLIADTSVCPGDSVQIDLTGFYPGNQVIYQWYNGQQGPTIYVNAPGTYWVGISDSSGCFSYVDTFTVTSDIFSTTASLGPDTTLCSGNLIRLDFSEPGVTYLWSTGSTDSVAVVTVTGNYWLQAVNATGCVVRDTVFVTVAGNAPDVALSVQRPCEDAAAQFTDQSASANIIQQWDWNFGDGNSSAAQDPLHVYTDTGTYTVSLTVTTDVGCSNDTTVQLRIYPAPDAAFAYSDTCERSGTSFFNQSIANVGSITETRWNFGVLSASDDTSDVPLPVYTYGNSGIYEVRLIAGNTYGCSDTTSRIVTIKEGPVADFSYNKECLNDPVQFVNLSGAALPLTITSYKWKFTPVDSSVMISPRFTFTSMGAYPVTFTVGTNNGCFHSFTDTLVIDKFVNAGFTVPNDTLCRFQPYQYSDTSSEFNTAITSWAWRFDNNGTSTAEDPLFTFSEAGLQQVRLIVTSADNCTDSAKITVRVKTPPVAGYTVNQQVGFPPLTVTFNNTSSADVTDFQWTLGNGVTSDIPNPVTVYTDSGVYTATLIVTDGVGCSDTVSRNITVVRPSYNILLQDLVCTESNGYIQFTTTMLNQSNITLNGIDWRAGMDNTLQLFETWSGDLDPGQYLAYTFTGQALITHGAEICCAEVYRVQSVLGDSMITERICVPLIHDFSVLDPYPNPATGVVNIFYVLPVDEEVEVKVSDISGKIVRSLLFESSEGVNLLPLDMTGWAAGVYSVTFYYREKEITKKIVKLM